MYILMYTSNNIQIKNASLLKTEALLKMREASVKIERTQLLVLGNLPYRPVN